ncbi:hypothetical protein B0H21DRAFT_206131 [Amylocystis lapponica]|nr:hypothetical protein B0H21DRAFT_206131 [Amylocystis lapponica]
MFPPPQPPQEATDIFSISDQVLASRLQFIEEIGFGNWGSVWLCRPKPDPDSSNPLQDSKIAVKLVHRSKTSTTAARVRSLWNEMKVVRSLKHEPHPSIIPFYSFIITPSYALITMAFQPRLIPVEVPESHSKEWFRSLLSGVEFLHKRGVVHNDIKPANILLSHENVPVLVDFGFAERYEIDASKAFHSNLSYGTPEYLSPERARGLPHDTRKSDVWSLGVTFFEILIGRTPFEHSEGEQFSTKEDLEKYWNRTLRGKWVGSWKMSKSFEKLLRRMISPNADLRCTALDAMADSYWEQKGGVVSSHRKATSVSHAPSLSLHLEKDVASLHGVVSPWAQRTQKDKEVAKPKRKVEVDKENGAASPEAKAPPRHVRSQSQPKLQMMESHGVNQTRKNAVMPSLLATLSPVKHSPPAPAGAMSDKENTPQRAGNATRVPRRPLGPRSPTPPGSPVAKRPEVRVSKENTKENASDKDKNVRRSRVFKDITVDRNVEGAKKGSVRDRMKEWERERERLREMERLKERMREVEEEREREREWEREREEEEREREEARARELEVEHEREAEREYQRATRELWDREPENQKYERQQVDAEHECPKITLGRSSPSLVHVDDVLSVPLSPLVEEPSDPSLLPEYSRSGNESGLSLLKHGLKISIDKTMRLYKSSANVLKLPSPGLHVTMDMADDDESRMSVSERMSWEDDSLIRKAKSSLPVVRHAVHSEELAAANQLDRMTIWIRNVEKVVEDARQTFAASTTSTSPLPPLPVAPVSRRASLTRTNRSARAPRKILPANQIFVDGYESGVLDRSTSSAGREFSYSTAINSGANATNVSPDQTLPTIPSEQPSRVEQTESLAVPQTPSRKRRATVVTHSPEPGRVGGALEIDTVSPYTSPSKRREKSKSQNDLARPITPVTKLEFELEKLALPSRPKRLSAVVDRSLFVASSPVSRLDDSAVTEQSKNELTASPLNIEPYPRKTEASKSANALDTPARKHVESVYDRFLMSTTGVRRLGHGYQSDNIGPMSNIPLPMTAVARRNQKFFNSTRRPMPPPVSSDDIRRASSVDEFGVVVCSQNASNIPSTPSEQNKNTVAIVRRAFKAIVTGKTVTTRFSKAI